MPPREKKEIDPEVLMKMKFRAKCRFKACGRLVAANVYWLIEDIDHYEGIDDVKRRVDQAMRTKVLKKQLLSVKDKALLNKPAAERTEQEKKYLYRIIGGLKCFKRYPNNVKRKLAAVTYFRYYGPNRVIIRQNHEGHAMYFIVSGSVSVTKLEYDGLLKKFVPVVIGVLNTGDFFGEVSLIHNVPRMTTCTTTDHCELLVLLKEDFKTVLLASVQKQWDEVRTAMSYFTYFDALDEIALREGCIIAKLKSYEIDQILYGDGQGVANYVYFILSGRCQMIESLQVFVKTIMGKKFYRLHDPYVQKEESEEDFEQKWFGKHIPTVPDLVKFEQDQQQRKRSDSIPRQNSALKHRASTTEAKRTSFLVPSDVEGTSNGTQKLPIIAEVDKDCSKTILRPSESEHPHRLSAPFLAESPALRKEKLKTYFMQVCQFNPGSSFGFGENMRDRRIKALTPVQCMLLPKVWLLQRNTANIWTRIQYYLEKKIPTKKKLFQEFLQQQQWEDYKFQLVEDVMRNSNVINFTSVHDVPYSIRMDEMLDV